MNWPLTVSATILATVVFAKLTSPETLATFVIGVAVATVIIGFIVVTAKK